MAIERRAVKKRILKSGQDRTDTAVYVLLKYGVTDDADVAQKLVQSNDEVLFPSDLSYYTDQVDQDLGMGKTSPEVVKIRNALAEFYGLYEPEQETEEEIPSELDDLLGSIREEELEEPSAPPSSALAIYEGIGGEDIVDEEIDERILKLLKLDGVYDIDYATYMTLLKERMVAGRMADSSIPTEEVELLTNEFKRVKGKVGRFKLKKKRITAEDMGTTGPVTVSDDQFFLTSAAVIPKKSADPEAEEDNSEVLKKLDDILTSLRMENKDEKKNTRSDKKDAEEEKRRKREKKLESGKRKEFKNLINNVIAPVTNILQDIINWFKWTFIGFVFNQVLGWFQDPENKKKVEALSAFVKAFWPAILAAAVLFLTPFGAFIRSTIKLLRWAIPKMFGIIKKHPRIAAATALLGAGLLVPQMFPQTVNEQEKKTKEAAGTKEEKIAALKKQKENLNPLQIIQGVGAEIDDQIKFLETGKTAQYGAAPLNSNNSALKLDDENADLSEMPDVLSQFQDVEGMSGGGIVGGNLVNNYFDIGNHGQGMGFNEGGIVHNRGGSYNNYTTLDGSGSFQPMFGFTGGGMVLPDVNVPKMNANISLFSGGGRVTNRALNVNDIRFEGGGSITNNSGVDITGAGPDTQLIAAKPGEIVMSTEAVNHWGASTLLGMNKAGGGTNVPKMANNIQMAAGGGMVGAPLSGGGTASLDPTKTAASMPHVFAAAKAAGPSASISVSSSFGSAESPFHGPPTDGGMNYDELDTKPTRSGQNYSVSAPIIADPGQKKMSSEMLKNNPPNLIRDSGSYSVGKASLPKIVLGSDLGIPKQPVGTPSLSKIKITGSRPTTLFKSERLNKASTGIKPGAWKDKKPVNVELKADISPAMNPVKTPMGNKKPNIIQLPTKTTSQEPPTQNASSAPDIPKFSSSRASAKRQSTMTALGIVDLVG